MGDGKKTKRIEVNQKIGPGRVRASRTGGVNAAISPLKGVTLNTRHGARVSKTYKGLTLGLQNFNSVVRGRWSTKDKRLNLNLSKSGVSVSARSSTGVFNFKNPKRSSATIAGIQVRGETAAIIAGVGLFLDAAWFFIKLFFIVSFRLTLIALWLAATLWKLLVVLVSFGIFLAFDLPKQIREARAAANSQSGN